MAGTRARRGWLPSVAMPALLRRPSRPRRLLVVPLLALALLGLAGCGDDEVTQTPSTSQPGTCDFPAAQAAAREVDPPPSDPASNPPTEATIVTDQGDLPISLEPEEAPCTVASFLSLVEQGYFDDTPCHRLTEGGLSVLQCGDPTGTGQGGPGYALPDELVDDDPRLQPCLDQVDQATGRPVCTYPAGTLAMANAGPGTGGSQFFLVYKDSYLPNAYTVFGRLSAAGLEVVRDVASAGVAADGTAPATPVTIEDVTTSD